MSAGMDQARSSDEGPKRRIIAVVYKPSPSPKKKRMKMNGIMRMPYWKKLYENKNRATSAMTPTEINAPAVPTKTRPAMYCHNFKGDAKRFMRFRDHTSSRNEMPTPCRTRMRKFQRITVPIRTVTTLRRSSPIRFKYTVKKPQSKSSRNDQ